MPQPPYRRVAVVGVGLIGGSVALALRERGLAEEVVGVVRTEKRVAPTLACGVVEEATADLAEGCREADVVVVATPVSRIAAAAVEAAGHVVAGALITDAGSTKEGVVIDVNRALPPESDAVFVGAHPLAGDDKSGPEAARGDLFDGAVTVVTPVEDTPAAATAHAQTFWEALGSRVVFTTPAGHDELLAITSHVPHVAAAAVAAATPTDALPLTATGWADTTRVAAGSPTLWREILMSNREPIARTLRDLAAGLEGYAAALDAGDGDRLEQLLEEGRRRRTDVQGDRDALGS